jgi:hypothetical protein
MGEIIVNNYFYLVYLDFRILFQHVISRKSCNQVTIGNVKKFYILGTKYLKFSVCFLLIAHFIFRLGSCKVLSSHLWLVATILIEEAKGERYMHVYSHPMTLYGVSFFVCLQDWGLNIGTHLLGSRSTTEPLLQPKE